MARYLNREPYNERNRTSSPPNSGELVFLFEGAWHQSPVNPELVDGTKLTVVDFHQVAKEALGKAEAQGTYAFTAIFSILLARAPTKWEPPEWSDWTVRHKYELLLETQAVADLVAEHLESARPILTPAVAALAHFVVHDYPLHDATPPEQTPLMLA